MLEEWLYLLNDAFTNHGYELAMQEAGCRCLARLLEIRPYFIEMIGDDKERYQYVDFYWVVFVIVIDGLNVFPLKSSLSAIM